MTWEEHTLLLRASRDQQRAHLLSDRCLSLRLFDESSSGVEVLLTTMGRINSGIPLKTKTRHKKVKQPAVLGEISPLPALSPPAYNHALASVYHSSETYNSDSSPLEEKNSVAFPTGIAGTFHFATRGPTPAFFVPPSPPTSGP